jgi:hypothetical protein
MLPPALLAISMYHFSKLAHVMGSPIHFENLKMLYWVHTLTAIFQPKWSGAKHRTVLLFSFMMF